MNHSFFSDRLPKLWAHRDDTRTLREKFIRKFGLSWGVRALATVLAAILRESLGEDGAAMHLFIAKEFKEGVYCHPSILAGQGCRTIDTIVRQILREHLALPDDVTEVSDPYVLDRIAGLMASVLPIFLWHGRKEARAEAREAELDTMRVLERKLNGYLDEFGAGHLLISDERVVARAKKNGRSVTIDFLDPA